MKTHLFRYTSVFGSFNDCSAWHDGRSRRQCPPGTYQSRAHEFSSKDDGSVVSCDFSLASLQDIVALSLPKSILLAKSVLDAAEQVDSVIQ